MLQLKIQAVRREPISKSCEIIQADNLNCRRRLSRKAQCFKTEVGKVIKDFSNVKTYIDKISSPLLDNVQNSSEGTSIFIYRVWVVAGYI